MGKCLRPKICMAAAPNCNLFCMLALQRQCTNLNRDFDVDLAESELQGNRKCTVESSSVVRSIWLSSVCRSSMCWPNVQIIWAHQLLFERMLLRGRDSYVVVRSACHAECWHATQDVSLLKCARTFWMYECLKKKKKKK